MGIEKAVTPTLALLTVTIVASLWYLLKTKPHLNFPPGLRRLWPMIGNMTGNDPSLDVSKINKEISQLHDKIAELEERLLVMEQSERLENEETVDMSNASQEDRIAAENTLQRSSSGSDQSFSLESDQMETSAESQVDHHGDPTQSAKATNRGEPSSADMKRDEFDGFLQKLSGRLLANDWKPVGRTLGLQESELNHCETDVHQNLQETIYQMLQKWRKKKGKAATYELLGQALLDNGIKNLYDEMFKSDGDDDNGQEPPLEEGIDSDSAEGNVPESENDPSLNVAKLIEENGQLHEKIAELEERLLVMEQSKLENKNQESKGMTNASQGDRIASENSLYPSSSGRDQRSSSLEYDGITIPSESPKKVPGKTVNRRATLDYVVEKSGLWELSQKVATDWLNVGRNLNLPEELLQSIGSDTQCTRERAYEMLSTWLRTNGKDATYQVLKEALVKAGRMDLADTICEQMKERRELQEKLKASEDERKKLKDTIKALETENENLKRAASVVIQNLDEIVEESYLWDLSKKVVRNWCKLGRKLMLEQTQLDAIDSDKPQVEEKAHEMLLTWLHERGDGATYGVLKKALIKAGRKDLADKIPEK